MTPKMLCHSAECRASGGWTYSNGWQDATPLRMCKACGAGPLEVSCEVGGRFKPANTRAVHAASLRRRGISFAEIGRALHVSTERARQLARRGEPFIAQFDGVTG